MITHTVKFIGRQLGAIGKTYKQKESFKLDTPDRDGEREINKLLYERYEHIEQVDISVNERQAQKCYRERDKERQIRAIGKLLELTGGKLQPVKAYWKLREIEFWASKAAEDYCNKPNFDIDTPTDKAEKEVQKIFNGKLKSFFVNRDPRGYALKIDNDTAPEEYKNLGLHTDMGGYYILAPEI